MQWLLLRGLAREKRHWLDFPHAFEKNVGADVVTLDLPGFGTENDRAVPKTVDAMVDDIRARFAPLRKAGPIGLFAISLGGMVAMRWLANYPDDFRCGVVVNTSAGDLSPPWERFLLPNWPRVFLAPLLPATRREKMMLSMTRNSEWQTSAWPRYVDIAKSTKPHPTHAAKQIRAALACATPSSLRVPLLVLASRADRLVSFRCSEKIAARLQAPIVLHDRGGHDLPLDEPEWTTTQVRTWVESLP
jgi:pimeloyl-ACP methyl ester carboxylesterase